jgi:hypothetical protein
MDEKKDKDPQDLANVDDVNIEPLSDEALESASGGATYTPDTAGDSCTSCCSCSGCS